MIPRGIIMGTSLYTLRKISEASNDITQASTVYINVICEANINCTFILHVNSQIQIIMSAISNAIPQVQQQAGTTMVQHIALMSFSLSEYNLNNNNFNLNNKPMRYIHIILSTCTPIYVLPMPSHSILHLC
jgi:hypothetical protein